MYLDCKVVYTNDKSFNMKIVAFNIDDFFYELLRLFKEAECAYNPTEYDQFDIKYVEVSSFNLE